MAEAAASSSPKLQAKGSPKALTPASPKLPSKEAPAKADAPAAPPKPATASREDNLTYDLHHLAAFDMAPMSAKTNYMNYTRDSVQLLVNKIFALQQKKTEDGIVVDLPNQEAFRLPRARPIPKAEAKTRWQKFMEEKGMKKRKRSRLVFDEVSQDWKPRYGYKSAKKEQEKAQNWAMEVKAGQNPFENPFEKVKAEKKLVAARQKMREVRNKVEALGGKLKASTPQLVPDGKFNRGNTGRGKDGLREAVKRAQSSSASMGKFDRIAPHEATNLQGKKRKGGLAAVSAGQEKAKYMKSVEKVFSGGGNVDNSKAMKLGAAMEANKRGKVAKAKAPAKRRSKQGGKRGGKKR